MAEYHGARFGFLIMDSFAGLVIFVFIVKAAYDIFNDVIDKIAYDSLDEDKKGRYMSEL